MSALVLGSLRLECFPHNDGVSVVATTALGQQELRMSVADWASLQRLVDVLEAADARHTADLAEVARLDSEVAKLRVDAKQNGQILSNVNEAIGRAGIHCAITFVEAIDQIRAERDQLRAECERMRAVYEAAKACIAHQKTADVAHLRDGWLREALDLSKALEVAVDAAERRERK